MKKTSIAISLALALGSTAVSAATMNAGADFTMKSAAGGTVGSFADVTGNIGGGTWAVASPSPFFGNVWTAHNGTTFGPGSYTFDTTGGTAGTTGQVYTGVVVGAGQVGGHILFDWNTAADIDVVNVWDVTGAASDIYTSSVVTDSNGANTNGVTGLAMIDGAFPGFNANFNFTAPVPVPAAVWLFGSGLLGLVGVARRKKSA